MRFTFASIVLVSRGAWGPLPSPEERRAAFCWAAAAGFEGIEISPRWLDFHQLPESELRAIGAEIQSAGLAVSGLNVNRCILTRTERAAEHLARVHRAVEVAALWEAPILTLSLSMPTLPAPERPPVRGRDATTPELDRTARLLREVADRAADLGVALSLELHDDGLLDSADALLAMRTRVARPNVGLHPDLGNIMRGEGPRPDWEPTLRRLAPHANAWSVKNYRGSTPVPLWEGDIDHARAVAIMRDAGFRGWVGIESYFGDDVRGLQERSLAYLRRLIT